jgi:hypothetical protein
VQERLSRSGTTTKQPSGLAERLAIFARTFVRATPTLSGSSSSSRTSRRRRAATAAAAPTEPGTWRNASSIEPACTTGAERSKIANSARLAALLASHMASTTTAAGHRARARDVRMPPRIPCARAS